MLVEGWFVGMVGKVGAGCGSAGCSRLLLLKDHRSGRQRGNF